MTTTCSSCHRPAGAFLCSTCFAELDRALASVPFLAAELDVVLMRDVSRGGGAGIVSGTTERPLVVDLDAGETAWVLHNTLAANVRHLAESRGTTYDPHPESVAGFVGPLRAGWRREWLTDGGSSASMAAWLQRALGSIALDPSALEVRDEVLSAVEQAWRVIETPAARILLGPCDATYPVGEYGAERYCEADVRAFPEAESVRCRACGAVHDVPAFVERTRERMAGHLATARELADYLRGGFRPGRLEVWRRRGKIEPRACLVESRATLYAVGDVLDVLAAQERQRSLETLLAELGPRAAEIINA